MTKNNPKYNNFIGIDVSKDKIDIVVLPSGETLTVDNKEKSLKEAIKKLPDNKDSLCIIEPTGRYEKLFVKLLQSEDYDVYICHPNKVKDFARATGHRAKTDLIDAKVLAKYGAVLTPETASKKLCPKMEHLKECVSRKNDFVQMRAKEKTRMHGFADKENIKESISFFTKQIAALDKVIMNIINESKVLKDKYKLLCSFKGVGKETAIVLIALLPELGEICRRSIACLAGIAPFSNDSGKKKGKRSIFGGRSEVRKVLYMSSLSTARFDPQLSAFYNKLISSGKKKKVALIAVCRRRLAIMNAAVRDGEIKGPSLQA